MKQGVGFSATINIIAIFIVVTFAFLAATVTYYKAYKVNNVISDSIEKYEGYNTLAQKEIDQKLSSLGYLRGVPKCPNGYENLTNKHKYCVQLVDTRNDKNYYKYKVTTYINLNIPVVNQVLNIPIKSTTEKIYYFNEG